MATRFCSRSLISYAKRGMNSLFSRSFTSSSLAKPAQDLSSAHTLSLLRLRPLAAVSAKGLRNVSTPAASARGFSSRPATSSLNDSNPNWSNRPPKETILLDGCDFEHWLVVVEPPDEKMTRDEIIDSYIKTLAQIVGSEEEARMKIYSVSTRCYFAFGALVSEELSYKLKEIPHVRWVLPDSYLDVRNKDYGGEPFINGQAVPYDPKYHEEWIRNNARANERNKRNDRPRPRDRSRNFDRREMQQHPQQQFNPNAGRNVGQGVPRNMGPGNPGYTTTPNNMGSGGMQSNNMNSMPSNNYGGGETHSNYMDGNGMQQNNRGGGPYQAGPVPNQSSFAPNMAGGNPYQNQSMPSAIPPNPQYRNAPNGGNPYQSGPGQFQNSYAPGSNQNSYAPGSNQNSYAPGSNQNSYAPPDHGPNPSNYAPSQNSYAANVPGGSPYQNQNMPGGEIPPPQKY